MINDKELSEMLDTTLRVISRAHTIAGVTLASHREDVTPEMDADIEAIGSAMELIQPEMRKAYEAFAISSKEVDVPDDLAYAASLAKVLNDTFNTYELD